MREVIAVLRCAVRYSAAVVLMDSLTSIHHVPSDPGVHAVFLASFEEKLRFSPAKWREVSVHLATSRLCLTSANPRAMCCSNQRARPIRAQKRGRAGSRGAHNVSNRATISSANAAAATGSTRPRRLASSKRVSDKAASASGIVTMPETSGLRPI